MLFYASATKQLLSTLPGPRTTLAYRDWSLSWRFWEYSQREKNERKDHCYTQTITEISTRIFVRGENCCQSGWDGKVRISTKFNFEEQLNVSRRKREGAIISWGHVRLPREGDIWVIKFHRSMAKFEGSIGSPSHMPVAGITDIAHSICRSWEVGGGEGRWRGWTFIVVSMVHTSLDTSSSD